MLLPSPRDKNRFVTLVVVALFVAVLYGGVTAIRLMSERSALAEAKGLKNPVPATGSALIAGKRIYQEHCQSCHGGDGDGRGERAENLSATPMDFTNAAKMANVTDGELFWVTTTGHRPMPAFEKKLSEQERWQVVDYLRTFAAPPAGK